MNAGTTVGVYTSIEEGDINKAELSDECPEWHEIGLSAHLTSLYARAKKTATTLHKKSN